MSSDQPQPAARLGRRAFLTRGLGLGLAAGASPAYARAAGPAVAWRDRWVYRRLARTVPAQAAEVQVADSEAGLVLRRGDGEWALNHTAAEVWRLADGRRSVAAIAQVVAVRYRVPRARVAGDVAVAVRQLLRQGCLTA